MNPVDKINRNKFGNVPIKKFPENIGSSEEGLQHFMFITEYEFIHSHTKGRDALTSFLYLSTAMRISVVFDDTNSTFLIRR